MRPATSYQLRQARIADLYREAMRDIAAYPAIHYDLARARIAEIHQQAPA